MEKKSDEGRAMSGKEERHTGLPIHLQLRTPVRLRRVTYLTNMK